MILSRSLLQTLIIATIPSCLHAQKTSVQAPPLCKIDSLAPIDFLKKQSVDTIIQFDNRCGLQGERQTLLAQSIFWKKNGVSMGTSLHWANQQCVNTTYSTNLDEVISYVFSNKMNSYGVFPEFAYEDCGYFITVIFGIRELRVFVGHNELKDRQNKKLKSVQLAKLLIDLVN